ncbi:preprotein translocase subunit SecG [Sansalvadorimonas sp. 2012CJ34-2]|uniref:Protein-export membrane protein SecG n=1 Tax=Parendozoicomonas callyspongiae TaxID=2942213 RepID=A0ABT0PHL2_9GAMM|nr:preprotein translocase subunit SecG [Sansalvadorimonas sp. 2012CJ34-2]MCL6269983.1 preprotein translocase subunit SecG [Sansalvadorimonas sp. 2012CJ34-2]
METLILIVHVLVALGLIGLIMLQQGKGAETGASFGSGASQTVFGSSGSGSFLTRTTAILATVFFLTSIGLAMIAKDKANALTTGTVTGIPTEVSAPAAEIPAPVSDVPEVSDSTVDSSEAPVLDSTASAEGDTAKAVVSEGKTADAESSISASE